MGRGRRGFLHLYRLHPLKGFVGRKATAKGLYGDSPGWRVVWAGMTGHQAWKQTFGKQHEVVTVERLKPGENYTVRTVGRDEIKRERRDAEAAAKAAKASRKAGEKTAKADKKAAKTAARNAKADKKAAKTAARSAKAEAKIAKADEKAAKAEAKAAKAEAKKAAADTKSTKAEARG